MGLNSETIYATARQKNPLFNKLQPYENTVNYKRKSRRFFLLVRWRTPPISSEFQEGWFEQPNPPPPRGTPLLLYDVAKQHPTELSCHFCSDIICTSPLYHLRRTSLTKPRPAHTNWLLHLLDQNNGYSYLKICNGRETTRSLSTVRRCNYCSVRTGRRVAASRPLQQLRRCQNALTEFAAAETHTTDVSIQRVPN